MCRFEHVLCELQSKRARRLARCIRAASKGQRSRTSTHIYSTRQRGPEKKLSSFMNSILLGVCLDLVLACREVFHLALAEASKTKRCKTMGSVFHCQDRLVSSPCVSVPLRTNLGLAFASKHSGVYHAVDGTCQPNCRQAAWCIRQCDAASSSGSRQGGFCQPLSEARR